MKNTFKISLIAVLVASLLSGCKGSEYVLDDNSNASPDARACKRLKRQVVFNERNPNQPAKYITKSQNDRLRQLYSEYDCNNVLAGKPAKTAPTEIQALG